jgi:hypothetical protein
LLEDNLKSLRITLEDYLAVKYEHDATFPDKRAISLSRQAAQSRMFHYAKVFIVFMRRFAKLLEATTAHKYLGKSNLVF